MTPSAQDPFLAMERGDASTRALTPDASTLRVTAFNVGMIQDDAFSGKRYSAGTQDANLTELAGHVQRWLEEGPAVVGLNEIAPEIAAWLEITLKEQTETQWMLNVGRATHETNTIFWCSFFL